jgi:hypothetical protein
MSTHSTVTLGKADEEQLSTELELMCSFGDRQVRQGRVVAAEPAGWIRGGQR